MSSLTITFRLPTEVHVDIVLEKYPLTLRTAFGTSHSTTTCRTNGLIRIKVSSKEEGSIEGFGECGLPPKKPGVYLADLDDVSSFISGYVKQVQTLATAPEDVLRSAEAYNPFDKLPPNFFLNFPRTNYHPNNNTVIRCAILLFKALDDFGIPEKSSRVGRNGVEMALLDIIGKGLKQPLYQVIGVERVHKSAFYTVSLSSDIQFMLQSAKIGLDYTPNLKIKLNKDYSQVPYLLKELVALVRGSSQQKFLFSIDANADWTPDAAIAYLSIIKNFSASSEQNKDIIFMVEQPFPVTIEPDDYQKWKSIKEQYGEAGIKIYADESIGNSADISNLKELVHGVNIKLDKTGGIREAILTVVEAKKAGLEIWFGIMVSSSLSSTATSALLPLSTVGGDLDGQLLVTPDSDKFSTSYDWDNKTGMVAPSQQQGIGVTIKQ